MWSCRFFHFVQKWWQQEHVEGYLELSAKTKTYFATAVALWDADFYVKVDDDVHVNIGKNQKQNILNFDLFLRDVLNCLCLFLCFSFIRPLSMNFAATLGATLASHRDKSRVYIGCMKSGPVLAQKWAIAIYLRINVTPFS